MKDLINKQIRQIEETQKEYQEDFKKGLKELHKYYGDFDKMDLNSTQFQCLLNGLNAIDKYHTLYNKQEERKEHLQYLLLNSEKEN